ncbi:MAG: hypothetical protein C0620_04450 [Desulfuromonas sp.]|nr:MAG: hypothetical protein C0620_04450 [Desulfuromonas sp.]
MSMDLAVWSDGEILLQNVLPESSAWVSYQEELAYEKESWQVLVMPGSETPEVEVLQKFPKASKVYYVTLEPISAGPEGYEFLEKVIRSLAKSCGGVWVDPYGVAYFYNEGSFE